MQLFDKGVRSVRCSQRRREARRPLCTTCGALPVTQGGASGAAAVPRVPRGRLHLPFAVLLLRTSYEVMDSLDFVASDKFQVRPQYGG